MNKKFHRDVWVGIVLLTFCAWLLFQSAQIKGDAAMLPCALSAMMAVCAVFITIGGLRKTKTEQGQYAYKMTVAGCKNGFIFMVYILVYYLVFRYVTYWIATPIFLIVAQKHLGVKSWKVNLIITVITTVLCYIMFVLVLKLPIYKVGALGRMFRFV